VRIVGAEQGHFHPGGSRPSSYPYSMHMASAMLGSNPESRAQPSYLAAPIAYSTEMSGCGPPRGHCGGQSCGSPSCAEYSLAWVSHSFLGRTGHSCTFTHTHSSNSAQPGTLFFQNLWPNVECGPETKAAKIRLAQRLAPGILADCGSVPQYLRSPSPTILGSHTPLPRIQEI
jgi:hypothetical protein